MSDIADVLNKLNELGRTDLTEVVYAMMGERDGLIKAINSAKTVIESKDKAYSLIQQRWDAMAAKASTVDSERECNERLTSENDALRAELDALRDELSSTQKELEEKTLLAKQWIQHGVEQSLCATPAPVAPKDGPVTVRELLDSGMCPVPNGWALVPEEPTAEMTLAGVREAVSHPRPNVYRIYRAMLAAAQAREGK